jgi:3-hydroxyisobutyrate dehydrogenase-like beta-hydroxyacid dehydrogenase
MHVALIGAGMMGHGMAANLLRHGHRVSVIAHRNRAPVEDLVAKGAVEATSLEAMAEADVILLCLTTSKVVEETHQAPQAAPPRGPDHPGCRNIRTRGDQASGA